MSPHDPLELELAALRPHRPTAELKQRIHHELAATPHAPAALHTRFAWRRGAIVAALVAASLVAVLAWRGNFQTSETDSTLATVLEPDFSVTFDGSSPSLWLYRRALTQSADSLEDLLDKHASRTHEPQRSAPQVVLAAFSFQKNPLTGDL